MTPGLEYTIQVRGCMVASPRVCGTAQTRVALVDEPLQGSIEGGDRAVGGSDLTYLSACDMTFDPDDPNANVGGPNLRFNWTCTQMQQSWCSQGIALGDVCCASSCGTCGGSGCGDSPGGSSQCCTGGRQLLLHVLGCSPRSRCSLLLTLMVRRI